MIITIHHNRNEYPLFLKLNMFYQLGNILKALSGKITLSTNIQNENFHYSIRNGRRQELTNYNINREIIKERIVNKFLLDAFAGKMKREDQKLNWKMTSIK